MQSSEQSNQDSASMVYRKQASKKKPQQEQISYGVGPQIGLMRKEGVLRRESPRNRR